MLSKALTAALVLSLGLLGSTGSVRAEGGIVQNAGKDMAKGIITAAKQQMNSGDLVHGAKQVTKGMVDGMADAVPMVTSQLMNQMNVNKKAMGSVARQVSNDAVDGAIGATIRDLSNSLGKNGDSPLVESISATTEKVTAGAVRGIVSEIHMDPATAEKLSAAAVRGAVSEMHFQIPIWSFALAFILGGFSTLLFGVGLMVLYMLFQRQRVAAPEVRATAPSGAILTAT